MVNDLGGLSDLDRLMEVRRSLYEQFPVAPVAFSADGRSVAFAGPLTLGLAVGDFAVVESPDHASIVVQVGDLRIVEGQGPTLGLPVSDGLGSDVASATTSVRLRAVGGDAMVLGRVVDGAFAPAKDGTGDGGFGERRIRAATAEELGVIGVAYAATSDAIEVGTLRQAPSIPVALRATGFSRHTFMCGQSGAGKSYTTGVLFERLLAGTTLPLVVLDPNSDHVHLGTIPDPDDHTPSAEAHRAVAPFVRVARRRGLTSNHTLCADFSDLDLAAQALLLRLHPIADLDTFSSLRRLTAAVPKPYSVGDLARAAADDPDTRPLATRIDNLGIAGWDLWRKGDERSIVEVDLRADRCVILDIGSFPLPEERSAVALVLLRQRWARRHERVPMLLAIDEAHNILPASTSDPLVEATVDVGTLIAAEGRKFGLHLFIATQRPAKVHVNVVSQCDNLVLMRTNGAADLDALVELFSAVPASMIRQAPTLGLGQALVAGRLTPTPLFVSFGKRVTPEGGADVATDWAHRPSGTR